MVDAAVARKRDLVRWLACSPAGGEAFEKMLDEVSTDVSSEFLKRRRGKVSPETRARYEAEAAEADALFLARLREMYLDDRQNREIALLEFPLLWLRVSEELGRRGIPFLFRTVLDENVITVQVVNEHFMEIPVTTGTVDRAVGLMRYFINRPECAREEMPEIRFLRDFSLAREWNRLTAGGR